MSRVEPIAPPPAEALVDPSHHQGGVPTPRKGWVRGAAAGAGVGLAVVLLPWSHSLLVLGLALAGGLAGAWADRQGGVGSAIRQALVGAAAWLER